MPIRPIRAFTLIELLIVVAIIAILAAIAVPNFLEAQTRAKVARAQADMRSLATAIEAYRVDTNRYPPRSITPATMTSNLPPPLGAPPSSPAEGKPRSYSFITSPIAYITSIPVDPFERMLVAPFNTFEYFDDLYSALFFRQDVARGGYTLYSVGPDGAHGIGSVGVPIGYYADTVPLTNRIVYDPTNGTISLGNIWRLSNNPSPPPLLTSPSGTPVSL